MVYQIEQQVRGLRAAERGIVAHSTDRERPIRPNVITDSGDREHVLAVAEQAVASDAVLWRSGATDG